MNRKRIMLSLRTPIFLIVAVFLAATSAGAVDIAAVQAEWTPPDSPTPITMWGFIPDPGDCGSVPSPVVWDVGPLQTGNPGGSLTINLRNCLPGDSVSIVIPGQPATMTPQVFVDGQGRTRVRAFTHEAAPGGGTASYTWNNLKPGTFLYQSGSNPAKQVHMGLYGALTVGTYRGAHTETLLVYSEIDPALHGPVVTTATPLTYKPKYYLVNGDAYSAAQPVPVVLSGAKAKKNVLIRMVNAGLNTHVPVMQGPHMNILAEDGNPYPYPRVQYSVLLPAGKTLDAMWQPEKTGSYAIYDRSLSLSTNGAPGGGMLVYLNVTVRAFPWPAFVPAMTRGNAIP